MVTQTAREGFNSILQGGLDRAKGFFAPLLGRIARGVRRVIKWLVGRMAWLMIDLLIICLVALSLASTYATRTCTTVNLSINDLTITIFPLSTILFVNDWSDWLLYVHVEVGPWGKEIGLQALVKLPTVQTVEWIRICRDFWQSRLVHHLRWTSAVFCLEVYYPLQQK